MTTTGHNEAKPFNGTPELYDKTIGWLGRAPAAMQAGSGAMLLVLAIRASGSGPSASPPHAAACVADRITVLHRAGIWQKIAQQTNGLQ